MVYWDQSRRPAKRGGHAQQDRAPKDNVNRKDFLQSGPQLVRLKLQPHSEKYSPNQKTKAKNQSWRLDQHFCIREGAVLWAHTRHEGPWAAYLFCHSYWQDGMANILFSQAVLGSLDVGSGILLLASVGAWLGKARMNRRPPHILCCVQFLCLPVLNQSQKHTHWLLTSLCSDFYSTSIEHNFLRNST